jgi:hypothetical protein
MSADDPEHPGLPAVLNAPQAGKSLSPGYDEDTA